MKSPHGPACACKLCKPKGGVFWRPSGDKEVREYLARIGAKGGKATGEVKRRSPEHYAKMVAARGRKPKVEG